MKCFSCDALLTIPIKEDLKTGRCYCETCQEVISELYEKMFLVRSDSGVTWFVQEVPLIDDDDFDDFDYLFMSEEF